MTDRDIGAGQLRAGEAWFAAYLDAITAVLGHASRVDPARACCAGLLLPGERNSVEPMAAHQSLHHLVAKAEWDDVAVLGAVRGQVLPAMERHGALASWIVDDTGLPKQGKQSVEWHGNTAASGASRTAARWRSACRWPTTTRVCRSPLPLPA